jgi:predicted secreted hydrolase
MSARRVIPAVLLAALAALGAAASPADAPRTPEGYRLAVSPYAFSFPRDHASHPSYRTEWWYYTGHLDSEDGAYGFELTFFRVGIDPSRTDDPSRWALHTLYFAHLALTDIRGNRFYFDEKLARPALGLAGADSTRLHTWIDDWSVTLGEDGQAHVLRAATERFGIELSLAPRKPPAIHGEGGVSQKAEGVGRASHYYSLTRMAATGAVTLEGRRTPVTGLAWMDHEYGSNQLAEGQTGWDWFSLQLDDGRDLMLYRMHREGGGTDPWSSGTLISPDGRTTHLPVDAFTIEARGEWKSPATGAVYPAGWTLRVPPLALELVVTPNVADQELVTGGTVGVNYWEGSVRVTGRAGGQPASGRGYVELTGYAGRVPAF